jgi:hypothetical protein
MGVDCLLVTAALVVACTTSFATAGDVITACAKKNGSLHLIGELFNRQECKKHEVLVEWNPGTEVDARVTALEGRTAALEEQTAALDGRTTALGGDAAALDAHLSAIEARVTALENNPRSGAFVASLVATSGRWDYGNGLLGVPSADMQCQLDHPDMRVRVCSASELTLAAVRGKVPIGSYWLVDLSFEDQCRAGGGNSMPYMSNSSKRGTVLRVLANDLIINSGGQTAADCVNEHSVACCAQ